jgi:formylglycine-generating enzyme required for sulfatase activity
MSLKASLSAVSVLAVAAVSASPSVSNVKMTQDAASRVVTVTYDLGDEPAIVTLDITTNDVSIGAENIFHLSGHVNRKVSGGSGKTITWKPDRSWNGHRIKDGSVKAVVKAWATNSPPDYMVVDLTGTVEPRFYTCEKALPGGLLENNYYRTTAMVMRRIPADGITWTMGNSGNETGTGNYAAREWQHTVTMDHDYYMAVFEMTQGQYYHAIGQKHYRDANDMTQDTFDEVDWELRPLDNVRYVEIRNNATPYVYHASFKNYDYPAIPNSASIIGKLRTKTGVMFELPSEAEWEYACRAGTGEGFWNDGSRISAGAKCTNLPGRVSYNDGNPVQGDENFGVEDKHKWTSQNGTAIVGSYSSNKWGLYDMHGNVWEWCNDFWVEDCSGLKEYLSSGAANADGDNLLNGAANTGRYRVRRGGCWVNDVNCCRSAHRNYEGQYSRENIGFRLVCPVGIP